MKCDPAGLGPGATAPDFSLANQHDEQIQMSRLLDGPLLLVFYPYAFSGICSNELTELNDRLPSFREAGVRLAGISVDTMYALRVFAEQLGLEFDLLSDFWPHGAVAQQFNVFDARRGCAMRGSFLIKTSGIIGWQVVNDPGSGRDLAAHLDAIWANAG
jgi:peroxiredoxin